jgi:hypothetical protein
MIRIKIMIMNISIMDVMSGYPTHGNAHSNN